MKSLKTKIQNLQIECLHFRLFLNFLLSSNIVKSMCPCIYLYDCNIVTLATGLFWPWNPLEKAPISIERLFRNLSTVKIFLKDFFSFYISYQNTKWWNKESSKNTFLYLSQFLRCEKIEDYISKIYKKKSRYL